MSFPPQNAIKHNTEFEKCGGNYLEFQKNVNSLVNNVLRVVNRAKSTYI